MIQWETTRKTDSVDLGDLKRFSMEDSTPRKQKSTKFFSPLSGKKIASNKQHHSDRSDIQHCTKNKFFSMKNTTELCAEGAIGNLMNVLHCNEIEVNQFWSIVQSPIHLIQTTLGESLVPKAVLKKSGGECDSIQKSFGFFVKKLSSIPQVCYELNVLKT
jgi:hypothetical protein